MSFPRKFAHLLEIERGDVEAPDYVELVYAVCAVSKEGCGWGGWMIEGAFKVTGQHHPTGTGDKLLPAVDEQICPRCGRETFRTGANLRLVPSEEQKRSPEPEVDYEVVPIEQRGSRSLTF
jgi:hypothetical protein